MKRKRKWAGLLLIFTLLALFGGYFFLAYYYRNSFSLNTWINGVYCTGKTIDQVNTELLRRAEAPIITVTDREGAVRTVDLSAADYTMDFTRPLTRCLQEQNPYLWIENILFSGNQTLLPDFTVDEEKLQGLWNELDFVKEQKNRQEGLSIAFGEEGYTLINGLENRLNQEKAYEALRQAVADGVTELSLEEKGCYYTVERTKEQEELFRLWEKIEAFQKCGIIYDMGDERIALAGRIAGSFLETDNELPLLDKDGELMVSEENIKAFIKELAAEYDTYGAERTFESTRGDTVTVKGGTYGTRLNQKAEVKYLLEAFLERSGAQRTKEEIHIPVYERKALHRGKNDIGSTYIEVDMTEQKMYYYEEGELLLETEVVTGRTGRGWGTPEGVNYVYNKQKNRILRGEGYASPVKFWMPVNGGIGIHDANWRDEFGGEIYKRNGSHGCINTPKEVMPQLYEMVEIGTPVILFY